MSCSSVAEHRGGGEGGESVPHLLQSLDKSVGLMLPQVFEPDDLWNDSNLGGTIVVQVLVKLSIVQGNKIANCQFR